MRQAEGHGARATDERTAKYAELISAAQSGDRERFNRARIACGLSPVGGATRAAPTPTKPARPRTDLAPSIRRLSADCQSVIAEARAESARLRRARAVDDDDDDFMDDFDY